MTVEADLVSVLRTVVADVYPDVAPLAATYPYGVYQGIGGQSWRYTENTPANRRHSIFQINVWAATRGQALTLIRAVEEALCAATAFNAAPYAGEPRWMSDQVAPEQLVYGCSQDFEIVSTR